MSNLYLVYFKDNNDEFTRDKKFSKAYMFSLDELRSFVYMTNKKYGIPKSIEKSFVWYEKEIEVCTLSTYLGGEIIDIETLIGDGNLYLVI